MDTNAFAWKKQVQHLIERCLLLHMSRDQCIKALEEHASIRPLITLTGPLSLSLCVCVCVCLVLMYICASARVPACVIHVLMKSMHACSVERATERE